MLKHKDNLKYWCIHRWPQNMTFKIQRYSQTLVKRKKLIYVFLQMSPAARKYPGWVSAAHSRCFLETFTILLYYALSKETFYNTWCFVTMLFILIINIGGTKDRAKLASQVIDRLEESDSRRGWSWAEWTRMNASSHQLIAAGDSLNPVA